MESNGLDDKDVGPEVQISFPESVTSRIEELMGGTEQFDSEEFDAVSYINRVFPTEQSLAGVDSAAARCEMRLAGVEADIRRLVRDQAQQRQDGHEALLQAQQCIADLALQVTDINKKAGRSESMVREITAEIKQLDRAKSNLTAAITALNHYHMLCGAATSLRAMASQRQYSALLPPLQAVMQVLAHFERYRDIRTLSALRDDVTALRRALAAQILADFKEAFTAGKASTVSAKTLSEACGVVDALEPKVKRDLLTWFTTMQLQEYEHLFSSEQECAWLAHVERRYAWLKRHLLAFEDGAGNVFPRPWRLSERIATHFCEVTKTQLTALLAARRSELDVKLLLYAIQKTYAFELLLHKRFQDDGADNDLQVARSQLTALLAARRSELDVKLLLYAIQKTGADNDLQVARSQLTALLAARRSELDVKLLLYAIQKTYAFELLLHKRFQDDGADNDLQVARSQLTALLAARRSELDVKLLLYAIQKTYAFELLLHKRFQDDGADNDLQVARSQLTALLAARRSELDVKLLLYAIQKTYAFELLLHKRFQDDGADNDLQVARSQLTALLAARRSELDVKLLLYAIQKTYAFELLLHKRFQDDGADNDLQVARSQLTALLAARRSELDVKLLLYAIQKTYAFELLLHKRFQDDGAALPDGAELNVDPQAVFDADAKDPEAAGGAARPGGPWVGIIGACFEPYLSIYISSLDSNLASLMDRFIQDAKAPAAGVAGVGTAGEAGAVLSSCADLFLFYKKCLVQCAHLTTGEPMLELAGVFAKYLRAYAGAVLRAALPRAPAPATPAAALVANLHTLATNQPANAQRYSAAEISRVTSVITTAEYCLETTVHLQQKLKEKVVPRLAERIDLTPEQELFHALIGDCIAALVAELEAACEPALQAMVRAPWLHVQTVGDQSTYVTQVIMHLKHTVPTLRDNLASSRKYFTQFCIRFANSFIPKFIQNIYKCKPISTAGAEQLLLDTHMLKTALLDLPSIGSEVKRPAPATYTKVVIKLMTRAEMILKLVMAPLEGAGAGAGAGAGGGEAFVAQFVQLLQDATLQDFHKVLDMKGARLGKAQLSALDALFKQAARNEGN
ncbi:vacuolar protein sorting-associated protein 53 homolog [Cydia amplana]|uniref:vacuolar protein sorting-associated protein 53 homolog n=1 Tax=Cydia amplana TaxID=1869771 RepID=UPI002FE67A0C